jgi:hypothetical protein
MLVKYLSNFLKEIAVASNVASERMHYNPTPHPD